MAENRLSMRLDPATRVYLARLATRLNLPVAGVIRLAVVRLAQVEGVADAEHA